MSKESDPFGLDQHAIGAKNDAEKPDLSLLVMFGRALQEVGRVGTFGAKKYTRGGWQHVPEGITRYTAAMLRHVLQENESAVDSDSGLAHAAHAAWNALARLELMVREAEKEKNNATEESNNQRTIGYTGSLVPVDALDGLQSYLEWGGFAQGSITAGPYGGLSTGNERGEPHCDECGGPCIFGPK